jgi:hypothetical protein
VNGDLFLPLVELDRLRAFRKQDTTIVPTIDIIAITDDERIGSTQISNLLLWDVRSPLSVERKKLNLFLVTGRDASFPRVTDGSQVAVVEVVHDELADGSPGERPQGVAPLLQVGPRRGVQHEDVAEHHRPVLVLDHVRD